MEPDSQGQQQARPVSPAAETRRLLRKASEAMWNNETATAEKLLLPRSRDDPRFALALSEVHWANSILAGNEVLLQKTLARLNAAADLAQQALDSAKSASKRRRGSSDAAQQQELQELQLVLADANFLAASTMVALGQRLPAAWRTRKAWKQYIAALQQGHDDSVDASLARLFRAATSAPRSATSDEQGRALFGVGSCLVAISWIPKSTTTTVLAQMAGFKVGRRDEGVQMLMRVAESPLSVRAPLACSVLLIDLLLMPHGIRNAQARRELAEQLSQRALERWPRSSTFHWLASAEAKKAGKTDEALRHIDEATHECLATDMFDAVPHALTVEKATLLVLALMFDAAALLSKQCLDSMERAARPRSSSSNSDNNNNNSNSDTASKRNLFEVRCELTLVQALSLLNETAEALKWTNKMVDKHIRARDRYLHDRDKGLIGLLQTALTRATKTTLVPYELMVILRDTAHLSADNARELSAKLAADFAPLRATADKSEHVLHRLVYGALLKTCACGRQSGAQSAATLQAEEAKAKKELEYVASVCTRSATAATLPYCAAALAYYELADLAATHNDLDSAKKLLQAAVKALSLPCTRGNTQYLNSEIIGPRVKRALEEFTSP